MRESLPLVHLRVEHWLVLSQAHVHGKLSGLQRRSHVRAAWSETESDPDGCDRRVHRVHLRARSRLRTEGSERASAPDVRSRRVRSANGSVACGVPATGRARVRSRVRMTLEKETGGARRMQCRVPQGKILPPKAALIISCQCCFFYGTTKEVH